MAENYTRVIPEAPLPVSMLPRPEELTLQDLLLLIQTSGVPGQKTKAVTLSQLAAFFANTNLQEITLVGPNGKRFVLNGEGSTYTKPPTAGTLDQFTITQNDDGIEVAVRGSQVSRVVKIATDEISISKTQGGLESKVTLKESGIEVSYQTRVNGQVVTTTSTLNSGELDISLLKVLGEDNSDWKFETFKQQSTQQISKNDLIIGEGLSSLALHIFSKLKVWRQAYFDKDVEINGDLSITNNKKLNVSGQTTLSGVGLDVVTLNTSTNGGNGCWLCSSHGPDYLFYNQSASNGQIWYVINDTGNDVPVAYDYYSSSGGGKVAITKNVPASSCAAFLRRGTKWFQMV